MGGKVVKQSLCVLMALLFLVFMTGRAYADTAAVGALAPQLGQWAASGARVTPVLFTCGAAMAWIATALTPAGIGLVVAAVLGGYLVSNYSSADYPFLESWLIAAGYRNTTGVWEKSSPGTYGPVAGTQAATDVATAKSVSGFTGSAVSYTDQTAALAALNAWKSANCGGCASYIGPSGSACGQANYTGCPAILNWHQKCCYAPTIQIGVVCPRPGYESQFATGEATWGPATIDEIKTKLVADLTAGAAASRAAWEEIERKLNNGLTSANTKDKTMVDTPATTGPVTGVTPRAKLTEQLRTQAITDSPAKITALETPTTPGDDVAPPPADKRPYYDPPYAGAWSPPAWPTAPTLTSRVSSFVSSASSTGLFALPGSVGAGIGSGSCEISFNAGQFGTHTYSFCNWPSSIVNVIKAIFMVCCSWVAIRIVTIKGGGDG